ncbi:MAG: pseudouridine synthase [Lachnospiraceae bacterium]
MRIDKFLVLNNQGSRTQVKERLKKGQITVNQAIITAADYQVDPMTDKITSQGILLSYEEKVYYMLHKPAGIVSATRDAINTTVIDLLEAEHRTDLFPIGRLDKDTEGLILITNDGAFAHQIMSPRKAIAKTYFARIDSAITEEEIEQFAQGIDIGDDKRTLPAGLKSARKKENEVLVTITEGRYHQVKRMFQAFGQHVLYLKRISIGTLELDDALPIGQYRKLTIEELAKL